MQTDNDDISGDTAETIPPALEWPSVRDLDSFDAGLRALRAASLAVRGALDATSIDEEDADAVIDLLDRAIVDVRPVVNWLRVTRNVMNIVDPEIQRVRLNKLAEDNRAEVQELAAILNRDPLTIWHCELMAFRAGRDAAGGAA